MKKKNTDPTKICIRCGSKNVIITYKGLETDMYNCKDCDAEHGIADLERL